MEAETFLAEIAKLRTYWQRRSPANVAILSLIETDLRSGKAPWFGQLQEIWKERVFVNEFEPPALLVDMLHYRKLFYGEDATRHPPDYLNHAPESFWSELKEAHLQTNDADRSIGWLLVSCMAFLSRGTPFHLVDLGTSAGLTLIGDYLSRDWSLIREDETSAAEPPNWRNSPYPVLSRTGLDSHPRFLSKQEDRLWLEACLRPDNAAALIHFNKAANLFLRLQADPNGPKLFACPFEATPQFIDARLQPHPDEGLLIFNSQASLFLDEKEYAKLKQSIARILAPWDDRAFWAELEFPRDKASEIHQLRVHRIINGQLETRILALLTTKPKHVKVLPGWDFVQPLKPVQPPKITREEPLKPAQPGIHKFSKP